jgi:Flp pilus assembly pilin Flp
MLWRSLFTGLSPLGGREKMKSMAGVVWIIKTWSDVHGQDLIEYALISGFVAIAAGAIMPNVTTDVSTVFSKIASTMRAAATS